MAETKQSVRVTIFNQSYSLLAPGDPREVEELAQSVDELLHSIASKSSTPDGARIAVMACLHLADRLRSVESDLTDLRLRLDHKTGEFSMMLEQLIEEDQHS